MGKIVILLYAVILVVMGILPLALLNTLKPADRGFTWLEGWSEDYIGYVSYVKEGMYGRNTFVIRSLPKEGQKPTTVHLVYIALGKLGRLFHLSSPAAYHIGRIVISVALIYMVYRMLLFLLGPTQSSRAVIATMYATIATSPSLYVFLQGHWEYRTLGWFDFSSPLHLRMFSRPHYDLGGILFLVISFLLLSPYLSLPVKTVLIVGLSIMLGTVHPSLALILCMTTVLMSIILVIVKSYTRLRLFITTSLALGLGLALSYWSIHRYPLTAILAIEPFLAASPISFRRFWEDFVAFGPILWFGYPGLILSFVRTNRHRFQTTFLLLWSTVQFALFFYFYVFLVTQRVRYIQSVYYVPLAYGTVEVFSYISSRLHRSFVPAALGILMLLSIPTYVNNFIQSLAPTRTDPQNFDTFIFPSRAMISAYQFLETHTPLESTVLAGFEAANNILLYSHNYVIGNNQGWPKPEREVMERDRDDFFFNRMDEARIRTLLSGYKIDYVYLGFQERRSDVLISYPNLFLPIFTNKDVTIYKVQKN